MFIAFKMAYSCCFNLRGNVDFPYFLQKSFITSLKRGSHHPLCSHGRGLLKNPGRHTPRLVLEAVRDRHPPLHAHLARNPFLEGNFVGRTPNPR